MLLLMLVGGAAQRALAGGASSRDLLPDPGLTNSRLRFGTGRALGGEPEISAILPAIPGPASPWFIAQWKKKTLLRPELMERDPRITDPDLGRAVYAFNTPDSNSHLYVFRSAQSGHYVYELSARDGVLTVGGGTGLFLQTDAIPHAILDGRATLSLDAKIVSASLVFDSPAAQTGVVFAHFFAGFSLVFHDPDTHQAIPLFMQIDFANSRGHRNNYRGCYPRQDGRWQIVYGRSLPGDPWLPMQAMPGPLEKLTFSLSRYLCDLISQPFPCRGQDGRVTSFSLPDSADTLRHWQLKSFYVGIETNDRDGRPRASSTEPQGTAALTVQIANVRVEQRNPSDHDTAACARD